MWIWMVLPGTFMLKLRASLLLLAAHALPPYTNLWQHSVSESNVIMKMHIHCTITLVGVLSLGTLGY